ncbi:hypothetical protein WDU94_012345, partial [Cyamophila willieti]
MAKAPGKKKPRRNLPRQKQCCKICKKFVAQLPRHLRTHKNDPETKTIEFYSPKRKRAALTKIRKEGAYLANLNAGEQIITARPSMKRPNENYESCPNCKLLCLNLRKHLARCTGKSALVHERPSYLIDDHILIENVLNKMKKDHIYEVIAKDRLILKFGSRLLFKNKKESNIYHHVATKMRELGRLVDEMKEYGIIYLQEAIAPQFFSKIVKAIKVICGFDPVTNMFKIPSLPTKIGFSLKECVNILQVEAATDEDKVYMEQLNFFNILYEKDYNHQVNHHARQTLIESKWNNVKSLPEASDIAKLLDYLETNEKKCILQIEESVKSKFDINSYKELSTLTLVHLIVFNRKRAGEVSKLELDILDHGNQSQMDIESNKHVLSKIEHKLSELMTRIVIRGKKNKGVPLLLTPHLKKCCDTISKFRAEALIPAENKYFFASATGYIRGVDAIRKITKICQVKNLTSTNLRKHLATMVQIMSLPESELERLAEFMGHSLNVHKQFYRLSNDIQDRAKMTKLFICLSKGSKYLDNIKNKTFENINITKEMIGELDEGNEEEYEETDEDEVIDASCEDDSDREKNFTPTKKPKKNIKKPKKRETNKEYKETDEDEMIDESCENDSDREKNFTPTKKPKKNVKKPKKRETNKEYKETDEDEMIDESCEDDSDREKNFTPTKKLKNNIKKPMKEETNNIYEDELNDEIRKDNSDGEKTFTPTKKSKKNIKKPMKGETNKEYEEIDEDAMIDESCKDDLDGAKTLPPIKKKSVNKTIAKRKKKTVQDGHNRGESKKKTDTQIRPGTTRQVEAKKSPVKTRKKHIDFSYMIDETCVDDSEADQTFTPTKKQTFKTLKTNEIRNKEADEKETTDEEDSDEVQENCPGATRQGKTKKWVKWTHYEEKILNNNFQNQILLGPSKHIPSYPQVPPMSFPPIPRCLPYYSLLSPGASHVIPSYPQGPPITFPPIPRTSHNIPSQPQVPPITFPPIPRDLPCHSLLSPGTSHNIPSHPQIPPITFPLIPRTSHNIPSHPQVPPISFPPIPRCLPYHSLLSPGASHVIPSYPQVTSHIIPSYPQGPPISFPPIPRCLPYHSLLSPGPPMSFPPIPRDLPFIPPIPSTSHNIPSSPGTSHNIPSYPQVPPMSFPAIPGASEEHYLLSSGPSHNIPSYPQ